MTKSGPLSHLRPFARRVAGEAAASPPQEPGAPRLSDFSSAACIALAERIETSAKGLELTDTETERLRLGATADCALARASILTAAGRHSEAMDLRRDVWRMAASREAAIALTFRAAAQDEEFARLVAEADVARDSGEWPTAEGLYGRALSLFPLHHGYQVQHGHMLKEQDRLAGAEIAYRTALALGAPPADVVGHLAFVCARQDYELGEVPRPARAGQPMQETPTTFDIDTLGYLLWHHAPVAEPVMLELLRACATCEEVAAAMVADVRFTRRNGPLLKLLKASA